jgi:hypothetical protein
MASVKFAGVVDAVAHFVQFTRRSKVRWGLLLLLVYAGNVLVATLAWISVRLATHYSLG